MSLACSSLRRAATSSSAVPLLASLLLTTASAQQWSFVKSTESALARTRAVGLVPQAPDDLKISVVFGGTQQRFAQLRFGSAGTTRIAVVVDYRSDGRVDVYADANRDRIIKKSDRLEASTSGWILSWELAIASGDAVDYESRPLRLVLHRHVIAWAPLGYIVGTTKIGTKSVRVRRFDSDGNGSYSDGRDRICIDLDGDAKFDPLREVFQYRSVLKLAGERWILRENAGDDGLTFAKLDGVGELRLVVKKRKYRSLIVTLQSDEGVTVALSAATRRAKVPVGTYRVVGVEATVEEPGSSLPWGYVFTRDGKAKRTHVVAKGGSTDLDVFASFDFSIAAPQGTGDAMTAKAGASVDLQPRWTTADGLLINSCWRGAHSGFGYGGPSASIQLRNAASAVLDTSQSGFA